MELVALYTRVSTNKVEQESSLKYQREQYTDYCERKGYELVLPIYSDEGTGTSVRNRPNFIQMLKHAGLDYKRNSNNNEYDIFTKSKTRKPKFKYIIVKDCSRFSRSQHLGLLIAEYLRDMGVYIIFENVGLNTEVADWKMRLSMLFNFAEEESRSKSRSVKFSKQYQISNEIYTPSRLSYGYMRNDLKQILVNEKEAEAIKLTFELYKENGSFVVARQLNEKGYLYSDGKRFTADNVLKIINNKIYAGIAVVGKTTRGDVTDTSRIYIPKTEWKEIPSGLDTIISLDEWNEADNKRKSRINRSSKRGAKQAINDDFYGRIYCSDCGSRFTRHQGRNNDKSTVKLSYMCLTKRKQKSKDYQDKQEKCNVRGIAFNILDDMLNMIDVSKVTNDLSNMVYSYHLRKRLNEEVLNIEQNIQMIDEKVDALIKENEAVRDGIVQMMIGKKKENETIALLEQKIEMNKLEMNTLEAQKGKINPETIYNLIEEVEAKGELIEGFESEVELSRDDKLKMLKTITVDDYSVVFDFSMPSFMEEVEEFNSIFVQNPIDELQIDMNSFNDEIVIPDQLLYNLEFSSRRVNLRREHKEAREYWSKIDGESNKNGSVIYKDSNTISVEKGKRVN